MDTVELCICLESLAQKTRLELINILKEKGMTLKEIMRRTKLSRTLAVYHISVLERAGLVSRKYIDTDGQIDAVYELNKEKLKELIEELKKIVE